MILDSKKLHAENKLKSINKHYLSEIHEQILLKLESFCQKMNSIPNFDQNKSLFEIQLAMLKTLCCICFHLNLSSFKSSLHRFKQKLFKLSNNKNSNFKFKSKYFPRPIYKVRHHSSKIEPLSMLNFLSCCVM